MALKVRWRPEGRFRTLERLFDTRFVLRKAPEGQLQQGKRRVGRVRCPQPALSLQAPQLGVNEVRTVDLFEKPEIGQNDETCLLGHA